MQKNEYKKILEVENKNFWYRAMSNLTLHLLRIYTGSQMRILDAGCGTGSFSSKLRDFGEIWAIDVNPVAINYARKNRGLRITLGSIQNLPFRTGFFDLIVCLDVLYHERVTDDRKALREFYRVLKPNGLIIIRVPALEMLRGAHDKVVQTRHRYEMRELREKVLSAGFEIIRITYVNMILSILLWLKRTWEKR